MTDLLARWAVDLAEVAPAADRHAVAAAGADLLRRLGEPHRRYHTSRHLSEVLGALDELEAGGAVTGRAAALARVAAWFHDAVYDPAAAPGANEADSAALAVRRLRELGAAEPDVETVRRLVLATERHDVPGVPGPAAALHDADLWVLSADVDRFDGYCAEVRAEYAAVPDDAYAAGRTAVLEPFLARDTVYATAQAQRAWEERARLNLARELSRLKR